MQGRALDLRPSQGCFDGGGEMGAMMRSMDWSATPLGPVDLWPQALCISLSTCLNSRFAILIWWGPDLIMLYNDAYREIIAGKHPAALGRPGRECWPEIWHIIGPMLRGVLANGDATRSDDLLLLLERRGYPEECYFTFSYSPIRDESGAVVGVFTPVAETTERVIGERRLCTLRDLASRGSVAKTAGEACRVAAETLAANPYDVPFAALYLYSEDRSRADLAGAVGIQPGSPVSPASISFGGDPGLVGRAASASRVEEIAGLSSLGVPGGAWTDSPDSAIVLPLASPGQPLPSGFLVAGVSPRKRLDDTYRAFFELAAAQIATAIAEAEAYEHERRRAETLAELDRAKTAFFSNVSHEFRTPLTLMLGSLEQLLARESEGLPRRELDLIHRNALRLLKLVNNLLDFSRIEAGRVQARYEPVDLARFTADLASTFRSAVESAGLVFDIDCPPLDAPVSVDREMWEKIVLNLLSNAFKFTLQGSIAVSLRKSGESVELSVRDTGIGIRQSDLPRVFDRFHRIEGARGRTHEGSGIGLALVQELARLHGGVVRVESVFGRGSSFTVSIPAGSARVAAGCAAAAPSSSVAALPYVNEALLSLPDAFEPASDSDRDWSDAALLVDQPAAFPGTRPRVLLVDDNADLRAYLRRLLLPRYDVEVVCDGEAALASIARRTPDLILADVMMPGLDGFDLLAAVRDNPATAALPVILLSARAGEEARVEGIEAGADDYLTKPFSARELLARVASHLTISALRREAAEQERQLRLQADAERVRWRDLLRQAPAAIAVVRGPDHVFEVVNLEYARVTGRREESLIGLPFRDALPEIAGQGLFELLDDVYRHGRPAFGSERLLKLDVHGDGTLADRYFNFTYQPSRAADGSVEGILVLAVDVTEQVVARRLAEESERQFRTLADSMPQMAWMARPDGYRFWYNRRWYEYTGSTPEQMVGWGWRTVYHPDHAERAFEHYRLCFESGTLWEDTFPLRGKDGEYRWFLSRAVALRDSEGNITRWFGSNTDITEQRETEARLREAHKLESLGVLAGGIAHDFNNILTGVLGNASLVAEMLPGDAPEIQLLRDIEAAAERAAHLTRQMLAYSGGGRFFIEKLDLSAAVRKTVEVLNPTLPAAVQLHLDLDPALPELDADSGQLQQVITNIVLNAVEALDERGGAVFIKTSVAEWTDEREMRQGLAVGAAEAGPYLSLAVRDTGCGMDESTRRRIFDPFFSTKFTGRGLGLAAVAGIVRSHRGVVRVHSSVGRGSTIQVLFPCALAAGQASAASDAVARRAVRPANILVVDDEELILRHAQLALRRHGHKTLLASGGQAAVEIFQQYAASIDLVLLDLSMPGMDGSATYDALRRIRPDVKVIVISGYNEPEAQRRFTGRRIAGFVQKPYRSAVLAAKIEEALA